MMVPHWLYIRATVLPSPKGGGGNVLAMGCARYPPRLSPPGVACGAEGGTADFRTTTYGAAPTSPPEGVFRRILRKKYRRAVGTHYGPTRIRQAGFSLCHRRDGRAGTTILQPVSASDDRTKALLSDYGPAGLLEHGKFIFCESLMRWRCPCSGFGSGPTKQSDARHSELTGLGAIFGLAGARA